MLENNPDGQHGCAADAHSHGGSEGCLGGKIGNIGGEHASRAALETRPGKPQDEGAEHHQVRGQRGDDDGVQRLTMDDMAGARTDDDATHENSANSTSSVHNESASEECCQIDHAARAGASQRAEGVARRAEARAIPPVHNAWADAGGDCEENEQDRKLDLTRSKVLLIH